MLPEQHTQEISPVLLGRPSRGRVYFKNAKLISKTAGFDLPALPASQSAAQLAGGAPAGRLRRVANNAGQGVDQLRDLFGLDDERR